MEALGIILRSNSPWAAPLHIALKPGGGWRPCGDYRRLNCATKDDAYPIPTMRDFNTNLAGKRIFSKVDLMRGYMQIPMSSRDIAKMVIITPFGLWEFIWMPFGLKCATQTFQRFMDRVTQGLQNIFVYLDDILVASEDETQHEADLRTLFERLAEHGLVIKKSKCVFGADGVDILGHRVDRHSTRPLPEKVRALRDLPAPKATDELRRFLHGWIAHFGTPSVITSDRGSQFVSELWQHFSTLLGIKLHPTTAYHPQANGLVERFHRL